MKVKTSVTLSQDVVKAVDASAGKDENRSQAIERLLRVSLAAEARRLSDAHDRAAIDQSAAELNAEVADVLNYQGDR
jgi:metal-responsive CopG/Arc/MetJ family transcriptional regulator